MMDSMPGSPDSYSTDCSEEDEKKIDEMIKDKSVKEIRGIQDYLRECCQKLESTIESTCKYEDFQDAKKEESY